MKFGVIALDFDGTIAKDDRPNSQVLAPVEAARAKGIAVGLQEGSLKKFTFTGRLTPHVRHRFKYLEIPMPEWRGFVFTRKGEPIGKTALTLKEFVSMLGQAPVAVLEGHARRGDFSRWIGGVLGDHPLARDIQKVEKAFVRGEASLLCESLVEPIRERYELTGVPLPVRICRPRT